MPTDVQSRFGAAVRFLRKGQGLSQETLAGRAGLHRTYVADVERGARNLSLASIEKLAQALGIPLPALFAQASGGENPPSEEMVNILLAEPDAKDLKWTLDAFRSVNLTNRVQVVRDGAEALEVAVGTRRPGPRQTPWPPLLILLNLELPRVSGLDVLRRVRDVGQNGATRVVILTRSAQQRGVAEAMRLGAQAVLVKPFDFNRLAAVVPQLNLGWSLRQPSLPVV
jgi:CheY-like chemotaxis protein